MKIILLILTAILNPPSIVTERPRPADLQFPIRLTDENIPDLVRLYEEDTRQPYYLLVKKNWLAEAHWIPSWEGTRWPTVYVMQYGNNPEATDSILAGDLNQNGKVDFTDFIKAVEARNVTTSQPVTGSLSIVKLGSCPSRILRLSGCRSVLRVAVLRKSSLWSALRTKRFSVRLAA